MEEEIDTAKMQSEIQAADEAAATATYYNTLIAKGTPRRFAEKLTLQWAWALAGAEIDIDDEPEPEE